MTDPNAPIDPEFGCQPVSAAAAHTLRRLHDRDLRLVLSSNNLTTQDRRLALHHAGVEHLFAALVTSTDLEYGKPDPRFYAAVLAAADCPPEQVLFAGNNYLNDVATPISHGMRAVLIRPHGRLLDGEDLPPDIPVTEFGKLPAFLDSLHGT